MNPKEAKYYRNRGLCYTRLENSDKALADYRTALIYEPESVRGLTLLSRELCIVDELPEALALLEKGEIRYMIIIECKVKFHPIVLRSSGLW